MSQPVDRITLRVAEGRRVRLPDGATLPEGEDLVLDRTPFVLRRIRSGDLVPAPARAARTASKKDD